MRCTNVDKRENMPYIRERQRYIAHRLKTLVLESLILMIKNTNYKRSLSCVFIHNLTWVSSKEGLCVKFRAYIHNLILFKIYSQIMKFQSHINLEVKAIDNK